MSRVMCMLHVCGKNQAGSAGKQGTHGTDERPEVQAGVQGRQRSYDGAGEIIKGLSLSDLKAPYNKGGTLYQDKERWF